MRYPTKFFWQCNLFFKQFFLKETRCWCCIRFFFPHVVSRPPQRGKGESVRREGSSNPKPPTYLSRHAKFTPASLAKEARETVKSVKTLIEEEREYYNTVLKQISGAWVELPWWWRGRGVWGREIVVTHLTSPSPFKRLTRMLWLQRQPMISISQLIFTSLYHKKCSLKYKYIKRVWKWLGASVHFPCK